MRHFLNLKIIWAVLTSFQTVGPFDLNWETGQYKCRLSQCITFSLLAALQSINLFWLFLIMRIAKNFMFTNVVQDERSDNEDEVENIPAKEEAHAKSNGRLANGCECNGRAATAVKRKNAKQGVLQNGDVAATQTSTSETEKSK